MSEDDFKDSPPKNRMAGVRWSPQTHTKKKKEKTVSMDFNLAHFGKTNMLLTALALLLSFQSISFSGSYF